MPRGVGGMGPTCASGDGRRESLPDPAYAYAYSPNPTAASRPPYSHTHTHSHSLSRTYSNNSTASTAPSSDFLPTPKTPHHATDRGWSSVGPAAAAVSRKGKGPAMVDPRFSFPRGGGGMRRGSNGPVIVDQTSGGGAGGGFVASL